MLIGFVIIGALRLFDSHSHDIHSHNNHDLSPKLASSLHR